MCAPGQLLGGAAATCTQVLGEPAYGCSEDSVTTPCPTLKGQQPPHCSGTTCVPGACKAGYVDCNGNPSDGCEAWMLDKATCGSCTNACAANQVCTSTGCAAACGPLETQTANGSCVNKSVCDPGQCPSPLHGIGTCVSNACAVTCDAGYTLCNGKCVDLQNDPTNCGICTHGCGGPPGGGAAACVSGACQTQCPPGFTLCSFTDPLFGNLTICSNLQTDLRSCGACGNACSTELCVGGACDPTQPRVLATNVKIAHLAVDAAYVYYADDTGSTLSRVAKTGGTPQVLVSGETKVGGLALDSTHLYWSSTMSNAIERVPLAGGTAQMVAAASNPGPLAVDAANVFWANNSNLTVLEAPKGGGAITTFATAWNCNGISDVQIDGLYLYWNQPGGTCQGLWRQPKDGSGSAEKVLTSTGPVIAFDQDYVYVGDDAGGAGVMRRRKDLSKPKQGATGGGVVYPMGLGVAGIFTYTSYAGGLQSGRELKCGGRAPLMSNPASFYPLPYGMPIVTDSAYLYTAYGSQLERLPL